MTATTRAERRSQRIHQRALERANGRRLQAVAQGLVPATMTVEQYIQWEDERQKLAIGSAIPQAGAGATTSTTSVQPAPASLPASQPPPTPFIDIHDRPLYLGDLYRNAVCFMLLSGPSARELDLSQLDRRGIFTIGVNNSPCIKRTRAFAYVDRANKFHSSIWLDPGVLKIVPRQHLGKTLRQKLPDGGFVNMLKRMPDGTMPLAQVRDMPGVIGCHRNAHFNPDTWLTEPSINWGNSARSAKVNKLPHILNVMLFAVRTVYALGFRTLFLLGCDFYMAEDQPYAFQQTKPPGAVASNNQAYRVLNELFGVLRPKFDEANFSVFNCNPKSLLTIFDFCDYHQAIDFATKHVPQDPLDSSGWYE